MTRLVTSSDGDATSVTIHNECDDGVYIGAAHVEPFVGVATHLDWPQAREAHAALGRMIDEKAPPVAPAPPPETPPEVIAAADKLGIGAFVLDEYQRFVITPAQVVELAERHDRNGGYIAARYAESLAFADEADAFAARIRATLDKPPEVVDVGGIPRVACRCGGVSIRADLPPGTSARCAVCGETVRPPVADERPHTRACGWRAHPHGPECHPTCVCRQAAK